MTRVSDRQTDGRTDGQTDRQTEFSSLDRVCIACSAVKNLVRIIVNDTSKMAKINFINSGAVDIIRTVYYIL